jgi:hypothetical protein|tara:strand:- start:1302 stop:1469 length:168 start_codon:yes stop_codon:yes gene_type:complete
MEDIFKNKVTLKVNVPAETCDLSIKVSDTVVNNYQLTFTDINKIIGIYNQALIEE